MASSSDFDGSADILVYNNAGAPVQSLTYGFSFGLWVNPDVVSGGSKYIMSLADSGVSNNFIGFRIDGSTLYIGMDALGTGDHHSVGSISASEWRFLVIVIASDTDRKLYRDGVQYGTTATTSGNVDGALASWDEAQIGALVITGGPYYYNGKCAWPRLQNIEMNADQITEVMYNPY